FALSGSLSRCLCCPMPRLRGLPLSSVFNRPATSEIYSLSLHDALPISDAIAGVVNFILKRDFEGFDLSTRYSVTEHGDGAEASISGLFGANFSDGRGNVLIGADFSDRDIIYGKDRDWIVRGWDDPGTTPGGIGSSNL